MDEKETEKRTLFYDQIYLDWAIWVGLGFGIISRFNEFRRPENGRALPITPGRGEILANIIDSSISIGISLLLFSGVIALIRRRFSQVNLARVSELDRSDKRNRKLFIAASILVSGLSLALISHFRQGGSVNELLSDERSVTECQPQGDNELCITATSSSGDRVDLDLVLTYGKSQEINGEWLGSSSWNVALDCSAQTIEVSSVKFLDERALEIPLSSDQIEAITKGLESESVALLSNCE